MVHQSADPRGALASIRGADEASLRRLTCVVGWRRSPVQRGEGRQVRVVRVTRLTQSGAGCGWHSGGGLGRAGCVDDRGAGLRMRFLLTVAASIGGAPSERPLVRGLSVFTESHSHSMSVA